MRQERRQDRDIEPLGGGYGGAGRQRPEARGDIAPGATAESNSIVRREGCPGGAKPREHLGGGCRLEILARQ